MGAAHYHMQLAIPILSTKVNKTGSQAGQDKGCNVKAQRNLSKLRPQPTQHPLFARCFVRFMLQHPSSLRLRAD